MVGFSAAWIWVGTMHVATIAANAAVSVASTVAAVVRSGHLQLL